MALVWSFKLYIQETCTSNQFNSAQQVIFNSIKREQTYFEFKLDVYKQTYKQTDKQTYLVLEVTPQDVGHLKPGTQTKYKPKSETKTKSEPNSINMSFI